MSMMRSTLCRIVLAAVPLGIVAPVRAQSVWNSPAGGDWLAAGDWSGGVPNAAGASATFTGIATAPIAVTQSAGVTAGALTFDNLTSPSTTYTVGSSGQTITLNNNGAGAQITVTAGVTSTAAQQFAAGATLGVADAGGLTVAQNGLGTLLVSGTLALGAGPLTVTGTGLTSVATGGLTGTGTLTKTGAGTLTLLGDNPGYTGKTVVSAGVLAVGSSNALGADPASAVADQLTVGAGGTLRGIAASATLAATRGVTIAGGATFDVPANDSLRINGVVAGTLPLNKTGAGTLVLAGSNTALNGAFNINAGTLQIGNVNALGSSGTPVVTIANGAAFAVNASGFYNPTFAIDIQGAGPNGRGALQFSGFSPVDWDGAVNLLADATIQVADTFFRGGIATNGHQLTFVNSSATAGVQGAAGISGAGGSVVVSLGSDNMGIDAPGTYTGTTLIHSGTVFLTSPTGLGQSLGTAANGVTVDSGGQLYLNGNGFAVGNKLLTLNGGPVVVNGNTKSWAGAVNLTADSTVRAEGSAGTFTLTGGIDNGGHLLTLNTVFADGTIIIQSAGITGAGGLVKTGPGLARINADSPFTGPVTFTATGTPPGGGTLQVNATLGGGGAVTVNNGGTLAGTGTVAGPVTVNGTGTIAPGQTGPSTLTVGPSTWARTVNGTDKYAWKVNNWTGTSAGTDFSQLLGTGPLTLTTVNPSDTFTIQVLGLTAANAAGAVPNFNAATPRTWTIATFTNDLTAAGYTPGMFRIDSSSFASNNNLAGGSFGLALSGPSIVLSFQPVPEPGLILLTCGAAAAAAAWLRRKRESPFGAPGGHC
jgi:autotransporter-associated beta strand protein